MLDVPATLASRVRLLGSGRSNKNDPNDAVAVAVCALRSDLTRVVTDRTDANKAMRLVVKRHRDQARLRALHCGRLHRMLAGLEPVPLEYSVVAGQATFLDSWMSPLYRLVRSTVTVAGESRVGPRWVLWWPM